MERNPALHTGHRKRLKGKFISGGLDGFFDHEVIELMLYYAIPRRDVNELSHQLIEKFGSVRGVLTADPEELMSIDGIGENTVILLGLFREAARRCLLEETPAPQAYRSINDIGAYFVNFFSGMKNENIYAMIFDQKLSLIDTFKVSVGSEICAELDYSLIMSKALKRDAHYVVVAHNHPHGQTRPSKTDVESALQLRSLLEIINIELIDHLTISGRYYSPMFNDFEKRFGTGSAVSFTQTDTCDEVKIFRADDNIMLHGD